MKNQKQKMEQLKSDINKEYRRGGKVTLSELCRPAEKLEMRSVETDLPKFLRQSKEFQAFLRTV